MKNENSLEIIKDALIKKAKGFYADEIIEEYVVENGEEKMTKKKVTKKYVPADLTASKLLLDYFGDNTKPYENMTDEELDKEAERLYREYKKLSKEELSVKQSLENENSIEENES